MMCAMSGSTPEALTSIQRAAGQAQRNAVVLVPPEEMREIHGLILSAVQLADSAAKIRRELGWEPRHTFETGLRDTVRWYLDNRWWWEPIWSGRYRGDRLGTLCPAPATAGAPR